MLRERFATRLRGLAQFLDGREVMDAKWHKASVAQMNAYIERTEDELDQLRPDAVKVNYIARGLLQSALDQVEQLRVELDSGAAQLGLRSVAARLRFVLTGEE